MADTRYSTYSSSTDDSSTNLVSPCPDHSRFSFRSISESNQRSTFSLSTNSYDLNGNYAQRYADGLQVTAPSIIESNHTSPSVGYRSVRDRIYDHPNPHRKKKVNKRKSINLTFVVAFVCGSIAIVVAAVIVVLFLRDPRFMRTTRKNTQYCLKRPRLHIGPNNISSSVKCTGEYCCTSSRNGLLELLNQVLKVKGSTLYPKVMKNDTQPTSIKNGYFCSHMEIGAVSECNGHKEIRPEHLPLRTLRTKGNTYGVSLENDHIVIHEDGRYLVNSQYVHKLRLGRRMRSQHTDIVGHVVKRYNTRLPNDHEQRLLAGFYTVCDTCSRQKSNYHVSQLSGIFQLDAGDKLFVGVSGNNHVAYKGSNYIAVIRLGSKVPNSVADSG